MAEMKQATFLNYSEGSFTNWKEIAGADYGFIAVDVAENKLVKTFDIDGDVDFKQVEKELNEVGYTIGVDAR